MTTTYVNNTVQTSVAEAVAYNHTGQSANLYLGSSGRILGLGTDGVGLVLGGGNIQTATLNGAIYGEAVGIRVDGVNDDIFLNGTVDSTDNGIRVEDDFCNIAISSTGSIHGEEGIVSILGAAGMVISNHGEIQGTIYGVQFGDSGSLRNAGTIYGGQTGVVVGGFVSRITNTGTIQGNSHSAVVRNGADVINSGRLIGNLDGSLGELDWDLRNTGEIIGDLLGGDAVETWRHSGLIAGEVDAGGGDDRLITSGQISDLVAMGLGNDGVLNTGVVLGDIDMGAGNDLYDGRGAAGGVSVLGGDGIDALRGGVGDDTLDGGKNGDLIVGGAGDDRLIGGKSGDVFAFRSGFGHDVITDFNVDEDIVQFAKAEFKSFAKVQAAMDQVGADVVITSSADESVTLVGVNLADLSVADFAFVA